MAVLACAEIHTDVLGQLREELVQVCAHWRTYGLYKDSIYAQTLLIGLQLSVFRVPLLSVFLAEGSPVANTACFWTCSLLLSWL